jgi:cytochrome c oxidase cbb3-type subunit I/II
MWRAMTAQGQLMYPDFIETTKAIMPMYMLRAVGGSCFIAGAICGGVNFLQTWRSRPATYEEVVHEAPALSRHYFGDPTKPTATVENMADIGKKIEVFSTLWFHRKWERLPVKFTVLTTIAVLIASGFEIIPTFLIRSNVPTIASVKPYTPLELYGRDIYVGEGCYNCHSQMIRPILAETKRYGEYSKPGEFIYDHPFQWGSRRIGPDLAREGGKQSNLWHVYHFINPAQVTPGSIMPSYKWMLSEKCDFESIPLRMRAMQALGVPYTDAERASAVDSAKAQAADIVKTINAQAKGSSFDGLKDKQVIAVIAYLQRLGTDLFK